MNPSTLAGVGYPVNGKDQMICASTAKPASLTLYV